MRKPNVTHCHTLRKIQASFVLNTMFNGIDINKSVQGFVAVLLNVGLRTPFLWIIGVNLPWNENYEMFEKLFGLFFIGFMIKFGITLAALYVFGK